MTGLRMTPTRLALLRAVRDGRVERRYSWAVRDVLLADRARPRVVDARMQELYDHNLARVGGLRDGYHDARVWELTATGERVLAEHPETPPRVVPAAEVTPPVDGEPQLATIDGQLHPVDTVRPAGGVL